MDPKMRLQHCLMEFNSQEGLQYPHKLTKAFRVLDEWGPSHERMYLVGCYINDQLVAQARGQSLNDAQMGAAMRAQEALALDAEGAWAEAPLENGVTPTGTHQNASSTDDGLGDATVAVNAISP